MVATTDTKDWKHNIVCCADHRVDYGGNDWYKGLEAQYCVLCKPSSGLWWQRLIQRIGSTILCAVQTIEWIMVATTDTKDWKHDSVCWADHRVDYGSND